MTRTDTSERGRPARAGSTRDRIIRAAVAAAGVVMLVVAARAALATSTTTVTVAPGIVDDCGSVLFPEPYDICDGDVGRHSGLRDVVLLGLVVGSFLVVLAIAYRCPCRWVPASAAAIVVAVAFLSHTSHQLVR